MGRFMVKTDGRQFFSGGFKKIGDGDLRQALSGGLIGCHDGPAHGLWNALADGTPLHTGGRAAQVCASAYGAQHLIKGDGFGRPQEPGTTSRSGGLVGMEAARTALGTADPGPRAPAWAR
jgi:hypothetical protein